MSRRLQLFSDARERCAKLLSLYPDSQALLSISRQIEYLIGLESGASCDRSRLKEIIIGALTAREVEPLDEDAATVFYKVAGEVARM